MANPTPLDTDKAVNLVIDDFKQLTYKDSETGVTFKYNLFVPPGYDKSKSYPLVLFMHDASVSANDETDKTLIQGLGAVIWATPAEQGKHPAIVAAPVIGTNVSVDMIVHFVNSIGNQYSVDKNRMYTTGQSLGCIKSIAIDIKYPDFFAASLLVAGQSEGDVQAVSAMSHQNIWIIVSEGDMRAYPGMNAMVAVWEKGGQTVSKAVWSARDNDAQMTLNANKMMAERNNIKYTVFLKGTTLPEGHAPDNEHMQSWKVAYTITAVRDWLFTQTKGSKPEQGAR